MRRRPLPWEALLAAVTEQLIEFERAVAIQRRMIAVLGHALRRRPGCATGRRAAAVAARVAGAAGVVRPRAQAGDRAAARGGRGRRRARRPRGRDGRARRLRLAEAAARRLLKITDIGPWTVEILALHGFGRHDVVAAGDLGFIKMVGRLTTGHPKARAEVAEVREFFAPYGEWKGLAGEYLRLRVRRPAWRLSSDRTTPGSSPSPGRNSLVSARAAFGGRLSSPFSCIQRP